VASAFRERDWDGHLLALYKDESQRRGQVAAWVRRGLEVGAKILHIEPSDESPARSLSGLLRDQSDAVEALTSGQIQVVPASDQAYDPTWQASTTQRALGSYPCVRWSGDALTAWSVMPQARHAEIERATDEVCTSQPVSVMCQYPAGASAGVLRSVSAAHSAGLREALLRAVPLSDGGLAVSGELDRSNQDVMRSVLLAATTTDRDPFVVDLSGLQFLDVGGARALVAGTASYRRSGGHVRLQVPPRVDHLVRLLGLHRAHGILTEALR
jgi:anti-anti-sigma factor